MSLYTLVEMYMSVCTTLLRGAFIEEFKGIQGVLVAAGGPAIPVDHPLLYFGSLLSR